MPTREQLIENIKAMETQGAQPDEIQSYLDSFKGKQPSGIVSPQPMDISIGEKVGSFLAPTATQTVKKIAGGEMPTGREFLGSALEVGSFLVPGGAVVKGALKAKSIGKKVLTGAKALGVAGGMAGAGREIGAGGDLGDIAGATIGGAVGGAVLGGALPVLGAGAMAIPKIAKTLTTKGGVSEKLEPVAVSTMQRVARIPKAKQADFEKTAGESVGQYLVNRGIYGDAEDIAGQLVKRFDSSKKVADKEIAKLKGSYKAPPIKQALSQLYKREIAVSSPGVPSKDLKRVTLLVNKYNKEGLNMSEINEVKRLYERNVKLEFKKTLSSTPESIAKSTNVDNALREWQFTQAEKLGLKNLGDINRETRLAKQLADELGKEHGGIAGNNAITLTDWIVLSGGDPTAIATFLTKKGFSSKSVQSAIAKKIAPVPKTGAPKAKYGEPKKGYAEFIRSTEGRTTPQ